MGVRGLQSFLKENRQSLCRSVILDREGVAVGSRGVTRVVVDAWGIIYQLYLDSLPWTSGGEYLRFYHLTRRLIQAWRRVGLEPTFVFDGAAPPEKHATLLERLQNQVATARMFYTISAQTRSSPSFSRNNAILPPFTALAFSRALADMDVDVRYVAAGEADGMCVVLADRMGGYVLGRDTDFVILASGASENMKGYVPLDMIEWIEGPSADDDDGSAREHEVDGSFTPVKTGKKTQRQARVSRLLPPKGSRNPTLVLATYTSAALCRRLRLPANLMPLFSSLVGNDYIPQSASDVFFPSGTKPSERIERVARMLREQQHAAVARSTKATGSHGDAAADLVRRVVRKLCCKPFIDDKTVNDLVDLIIEATIQYVLPYHGECCTLYPFCGDMSSPCPSASRVASPSGSPPPTSPSVAAYAAAQRRGHLNLVTHAYLYPDRVYLWSPLEDPSGPCARAGSVAVAARTAAYLIAEEGLDGLSFPSASTEQLDEIKQDHEVCKLLGVDDGEDTASDAGSSSLTAGAENDSLAPAPAPRTITEHVRQGSSNRVVSRSIELPPKLEGATPACLLPLQDRLAAYLAHLGADTPAIRALPPKLHPLAAVVRLCIAQAAESDTTGVRRWRKPEIEAVLRAGIGCLEGGWSRTGRRASENGSNGHGDGDAEVEGEAEGDYPPLSNRNAELVAQLSAGFTDSLLLAQALLLTPDADEGHGELTHLTPYVFFSGVALHSLLSDVEPAPATQCGWHWSATFRNHYRDALAAILASLPEDAVGGNVSAASAKKKKKEKEQQKQNKNRQSEERTSVASFGSRFDLLLSADV